MTGYETIPNVNECKVLPILDVIDTLNIGHAHRLLDNSIITIQLPTIHADVHSYLFGSKPLWIQM